MTENVRGLVGMFAKRGEEASAEGSFAEAAAWHTCAEKLQAALASQGPAEAVMWRVRTKLGSWMYFDHKPEHIANAEPLFTTPADSAPLVEALVIIAGGGLTSPSLAKIARDALAAYDASHEGRA